MLGFTFGLKVLIMDLVLPKSLGPRDGTQGRVAERQTCQDDLVCFSSQGMGKDPVRPWA